MKLAGKGVIDERYQAGNHRFVVIERAEKFGDEPYETQSSLGYNLYKLNKQKVILKRKIYGIEDIIDKIGNDNHTGNCCRQNS